MILEIYEREDHGEMIKSWWASRNVPDFDLDILPANGFVVDGIAAGWIYFDLEGKIGWLAWNIADKNAPALQRGKAVAKVVELLEELARKSEVKLIMASTENQSLGRLYSRLGFNVAEEGKTDYMKGIA